MTDAGDPPPSRHADLVVGDRVEVRSDFDGAWSSGFAVEEVTDGGYRLRRRSDQQVLPKTFAADDVRRERRNNMWWV